MQELSSQFVDWAKKWQTEHVTNNVHLSEDLVSIAGIRNGTCSKMWGGGAKRLLPPPSMLIMSDLQQAKLYPQSTCYTEREHAHRRSS